MGGVKGAGGRGLIWGCIEARFWVLTLVLGLLVAGPGALAGTSGTSEVLRLEFGDASDALATDSSGNGNDAALLNGATSDGNSLGLDGIDDVAVVDHSPSLSFGNQITVSAWVRRASSQAGWRAVVSRQLATGQQNQFHLGFYRGNARFGITTPSGSTWVEGQTLPVNQWVYLTGVYNGSSIRVFANGALQASRAKTGAITASTRPVLVGGNANGGDPLDATESLAGWVDEVRMHAQALSSSQISSAMGTEPPEPTPLPEPSPRVLSLLFDEVSDSLTMDSSGNDNDAHLRNGAASNGYNLSLDGVDDFAGVADSPSLDFGAGLTLTAWVQRTASQPWWRSLVSRQQDTGTLNQFFLSLYNGAPRFGVNTSSGDAQIALASAAPVGEWIHLAGVYDRSSMKLFVNGVRKASLPKTGRITASSRPVLIGADANGTDPLGVNQHLSASLDEVHLYNRALTQTEVAAHALHLPDDGTDPDRHGPVLDPIGAKKVEQQTPLTFNVTASDPDGDVVTLSAADLPTGASFTPSTGQFSWTPAANQVGKHPVTFTATDPGGLSDSEKVTITVTGPDSATSLTVVRTQEVVKASGKVTPNHPDHLGLPVKVALLKKKDGSWEKLRAKAPTLTAAGTYKTRFAKPNPGIYKVRAMFTSSPRYEKSKSVVRFKITN